MVSLREYALIACLTVFRAKSMSSLRTLPWDVWGDVLLGDVVSLIRYWTVLACWGRMSDRSWFARELRPFELRARRNYSVLWPNFWSALELRFLIRLSWILGVRFLAGFVRTVEVRTL